MDAFHLSEGSVVPFLIGTDEAGYGPNFGPLTITGTLWETESTETELYGLLEEVVATKSTQGKLFIADSKKVYSPTGSIASLETSVLALLYAATGIIPSDSSELVKLLSPPEAIKSLSNQPWLVGKSLPLPLKSSCDQIEDFAKRFNEVCEKNGVRLIQLQCMPIFAPEFNTQVERLGNKATLLSTETLQIVRRQLDLSNDDVEVGCDKHGGRSKYGALIQQIITDEFVMVGNETLEMSDYSFREADRDVVIRFQAKGESFLPTALASMVAKYVREVFMKLWNDFWQMKIPDLKPTKGYPVDAKRFKADIEEMQKQLGIDDRTIWRNR